MCVKKMGVGGFYTLVMSAWLCEREGSVDANCQNWPIIWTGIPRSWYTGIWYEKQCLQTLFPVSPRPSCGFCATFLDLLSLLSCSLEQAECKFVPERFIRGCRSLFWARVMDRSWTLSLYLSLTNCQLYRCSLKAHPLQEGFLYFANLWVSLACAWHISISVTSSGTTTNPKNICAVKQ